MNYKDLLKENKKRNRKMKVLRDNGWTFEKIGKKHGISKQRVEQVLSALKALDSQDT